LVSTSIVFFDFSVLDKFSQACKLLSTSYQKRKLARIFTIAFLSCAQFVQKWFKNIVYWVFLKFTSWIELLTYWWEKTARLIWDFVAYRRAMARQYRQTSSKLNSSVNCKQPATFSIHAK